MKKKMMMEQLQLIQPKTHESWRTWWKNQLQARYGILFIILLSLFVLIVQLTTRTSSSSSSSEMDLISNTQSLSQTWNKSQALAREKDSHLEGTLSSLHLLIVHSEGTQLQALSDKIAEGIQMTTNTSSREAHIEIVDLGLQNLSMQATQELLDWAHAIILGCQVINANPDPQILQWLASWDFHHDLSDTIGAVFVTAGGISAGEELTMMSLLHALLVFRMPIVGGEKWTSAFGASEITGEGPFRSPLNEDTTTLFHEKARGLGTRVAAFTAKVH